MKDVLIISFFKKYIYFFYFLEFPGTFLLSVVIFSIVFSAQENTYLCDTGNNELCNANSGKCECDEGYFAVDDVCAPNGRTGDLCREGTIGSNGRCMCYYGYTRLTDNTCGLCTV